jgi:DNA (cytosine-5)-methyltransferase 1
MSDTRGRNKRRWGNKQSPSCIGYSEIDKYAKSIYKRHFPEHKDYGDATKIITSELPDFDLLVGGFPCQAFSIAGKRKGFMDTRGTLFFEIARILSDKRPRYFLLENVQGLLSHDSGKTFQSIIGVLADIGYRVQWQLLNTKDYGLPQNRERIFIAGCIRKESGFKVFPITVSDAENEPKSREKQEGKSWVSTIDSRYGQRWSTETYVREARLKELTNNQPQGYRVYDSSGLSSTLAGEAGGVGAKTGLYQVESEIRRLTPIECERLQGFPENWTKFGKDGETISDTQRYKCLGNAVSTNVIQRIFEQEWGFG